MGHRNGVNESIKHPEPTVLKYVFFNNLFMTQLINSCVFYSLFKRPKSKWIFRVSFFQTIRAL